MDKPRQIITGELPNGSTGPKPAITCFLPPGGTARTALLIFPGGGYGSLSAHEGQTYAEFFSEAGIACFVVCYRLGSAGFRHPAMREDALAALYTVRSSARSLGIDGGRIGVMGSSAGGHLAAQVMVGWNHHPGDLPLRPDFGVLCYPVITARAPHTHPGSMQNLAGADPAESLLQELSCEEHVAPDTPPCFIWHTVEDTAVPPENSILFARALREKGVPFELHLYQKGAHGLGMAAPFNWGAECLRWIRQAVPPGAPK